MVVVFDGEVVLWWLCLIVRWWCYFRWLSVVNGVDVVCVVYIVW